MVGAGDESCGFVYAVSTERHLITARRAARTLRRVMPTAKVDLFTHHPVEDTVFDRVFHLEDAFFRPKIEALHRSRFDRTIHLDSDTVPLCDVSELFRLLDQVDLAGAQGWARTGQFFDDPAIPRAFPMLNSGVLAVRSSPATQALLADWGHELRSTGAPVDQAGLRRLLFRSGLPFLVFPAEYNLIWPDMLDVWPDIFGAPRILHIRDLHSRPPGDPQAAFAMDEVLSPDRAARLRRLIAADRHWPEPATCAKDGSDDTRRHGMPAMTRPEAQPAPTPAAETPDAGFVFAATGESYRALARRAARNVRAVMPDAVIDLFTDAPMDDPVFDCVHLLDQTGHRPKMEALRRSRFQRSLYLDCDVVMVAPVGDLFDLLHSFDLVGAHDQFGSAPVGMMTVRKPIPHAFRQVNSGVMGIRKSAKTDAFLRRWQDDFLALKLQFDQPLLRELLFDSDLRVAILPPEYNLMHPAQLRTATRRMMAPRLLHLTMLHEGRDHQSPADQPFNPALILRPAVAKSLNMLLASDRTLGAGRDMRTFVGDTLRKAPLAYRLARRLRDLFA